VLIEKAMTTPEHYPLSLNAIVAGANQKNNRFPITTLDDNSAYAAVEQLREKRLAVRVDQAGSRVSKYRHQAGETLHARTAELAILAELLLRGPQTVGELRNRASRMHPFDTLEIVKGMLEALMQREVPLVRQVSPAAGSRAERYAQLLCPNLHPLDAEAPAGGAMTSPGPSVAADRIASLEAELHRVKQALRHLALSIGEPDPLGTDPSSDNTPPEA
jgi:uncharacterized protein